MEVVDEGLRVYPVLQTHSELLAYKVAVSPVPELGHNAVAIQVNYYLLFPA